jgi:hypothetical protein
MTRNSATQITLLATIGVFSFASRALASDGDLPTTPPQPQAQPIQATEADEPMTPAPQADESQNATDAPAPPSNAFADAKPISMDRSDWPTIITTPADGSVTHNPHFTGNPPMGDDIISPLDAPDPIWQIQEALAGAYANNLNGENLSALGAQPFIAAAQFVAMPFRMILDNPLSKTTSP